MRRDDGCSAISTSKKSRPDQRRRRTNSIQPRKVGDLEISNCNSGPLPSSRRHQRHCERRAAIEPLRTAARGHRHRASPGCASVWWSIANGGMAVYSEILLPLSLPEVRAGASAVAIMPKYERTNEEIETLLNNFTYHAPLEGQPERYQEIREEAKGLADLLLQQCPPSRERSLAMTKLEEAVFWANASIARNETN